MTATVPLIVLQFATERTPDSALIRWFTHSEWSHVDIVMPDARRHLLGARLSGGVAIRAPGYARFSRTARFAFGCRNDRAFLDAARSQLGKPYDARAILAFGFNRDWRERHAWFCSELVAWCAEQAGTPLLNPVREVNRITPGDLLLSPLLRPLDRAAPRAA